MISTNVIFPSLNYSGLTKYDKHTETLFQLKNGQTVEQNRPLKNENGTVWTKVARELYTYIENKLNTFEKKWHFHFPEQMLLYILYLH